MKSLMAFVFLIGFAIRSDGQSFEWISKPDSYLCSNYHSRILENEQKELLMIGVANCKQLIYKFNYYGNLDWETKYGFELGGFEDFVTYDMGKTYYLIGLANSFPTTVNFFKINNKGSFLLKNQTITRTYLMEGFLNRKVNGKTITYGYGFTPHSQVWPAIEFRSPEGDTLGKFEYPLPWNATVKKAYLNEKKEILLFCSTGGFGPLTNLLLDSTGKLIEVKLWGRNIDAEFSYHDMVKKDSTFYAFVDYNCFNSSCARGYYIFRFNSNGDSIGMTPIGKRYVSIAATNDNGLILARSSLLKLDSNLKVVWEKPFREGVEILSVGASKGGGYYGSGRIYNKALKEYRTYVFRTNANGDIETSNNYPQYQIYPNPFHEELRFELPFGEAFNVSLYDMQGKRVVDVNCVGSTYINPDFLSQGVYWANITNQNGLSLYSQKLIKLK
jgi:hypothetical protein